jgi:hypothetical protein
MILKKVIGTIFIRKIKDTFILYNMINISLDLKTIHCVSLKIIVN